MRLEIIGDLRGFNRILGILIGGVAIPPNGETACFDFCLFFLSVFFLPMVSHVDHVKKRKPIVSVKVSHPFPKANLCPFSIGCKLDLKSKKKREGWSRYGRSSLLKSLTEILHRRFSLVTEGRDNLRITVYLSACNQIKHLFRMERNFN